MANLSSFGVLQQIVKETQDAYSLEYSGEAFDYVALELILKLNEDDIQNSLTDGPYDGGIDAIYIEGRRVHICSFKYTYDFEKTKRNFPGTEIDKIISTLSAFIEGSLSRGVVNDLVFEKYQEIKSLSREGPLYFHLHLASNKEHPVESATKKLEQSLSRFRYIKFNYYNLEDLVEIILQSQVVAINGSLTLLDKYHFEKSDANIRTIIGVIAAQDLIDLIKDPEDDHKANQFIFNENIRTYRPRHSINKGIIESALSDANYEFFYLNNGITILCEKADYQPNIRNPRVLLKNVQIINGGQTSNSIFEAYKKSPDKVANIDLLVRICEVESSDSEIKSKICETTNKQIPVGTRDLHSNDSIQRKLAIDFRKRGYFYERKPGQHKGEPRNRVLNNELLGQLYMAYYLDRSSEAKNSKRLVFGDLYEEIFNDERIEAKILLNLYRMYLPLLQQKKIIQGKKRKKEQIDEKEAFISRATFHIINGMKLIMEKEHLDVEDSEAHQYTRQKSIDFIFEVVEAEMEKRGEMYTHDKFFKEVPTNRIIKEYILSKYTDTPSSQASGG